MSDRCIDFWPLQQLLFRCSVDMTLLVCRALDDLSVFFVTPIAQVSLRVRAAISALLLKLSILARRFFLLDA